MALLKDSTTSYSTYVILTQAEGENVKYTDAVDRAIYEQTTVHCPTKEITVQVSLKPQPDEKTDTDWHDVETKGKLVFIEFPVRWLRVKEVDAKDEVYVLSSGNSMA